MKVEGLEPALTPEEWRDGYYESEALSLRRRNRSMNGEGRFDLMVREWPLGGALGDPRDLPALAAFALHQQTFGFTRKDVAILRFAAQAELSVAGDPEVRKENRESLNEIADRIEALLPPEGA